MYNYKGARFPSTAIRKSAMLKFEIYHTECRQTECRQTECRQIYSCSVMSEFRRKRTECRQTEGSNNALNVSAGCSSPTIYKFVDILRRYNSESELKILQTTTGMNAIRKKRNKFIIRNERIKRTVLAYNPKNKLSYCRSLGHLYE